MAMKTSWHRYGTKLHHCHGVTVCILRLLIWHKKHVGLQNVVTLKPKRERKMHVVEKQTRSSQIDSSKVL